MPTIRMARKEDLAEVLEMIRELAIYERAPKEVTVTLEELENDGFGARPMFEIVLAEVEGKVAGMAFYYPRYSTWKGRCMYLEDFIVKESMRGQGIGKMLFDHVVQVSVEFGAKRLEWQVLEWNEPAIRFYESVGAQLDPEWLNGRMTDEMLKKYRS